MEINECPALCIALCLSFYPNMDNPEDEDFFNDVD